ncbi:MAG: hypothetical protein CUN57_01700, partial [Phototrophicales bacterium]
DIVKTFLGIVAIAETKAEAQQIANASPRAHMMNFVGTPSQIIDQIRPYVDLGITHFMLDFTDFPSSKGSRLFADEVIPAFR